MKFVHYSSENKVIDKQNFINVDINQLNGFNETHPFNPCPGVMYLSMENDDGNSDWYNECDFTDCWKNGTKNIFNIDIEQNNENSKILILDELSDLQILFENYLNYEIKPRYEYDKEYIIKDIEKLNEQISICDKYFMGLSKNKKDFLNSSELLNQVIDELEKTNHPMPKIIDGQFDSKKNVNTNKYIANIYRLREKLLKKRNVQMNLVENPFELIPTNIDYVKIAEKYDGIYYTKKIIQDAKNVNNGYVQYCSTSFERTYKFENAISEKIYSSHNVKNNSSVENIFVGYLKWLETDTLIIWNITNVCLDD